MQKVALFAALAAALVLAACSDASQGGHALTSGSRTSAGTPTVVRGRAPVVWISGRLQAIGPATVTVVEPAGARVTMRRLAEGATRFLGRGSGTWAPLGPGAVAALDAGTGVCAEALRDRGVFLAIRVFVGATCGPHP